MTFSNVDKKRVSKNLIYLLLAALLLRLAAGGLYRGYDLDMNCFMGWADRLFQEGIPSFYAGQGFNDYPPGYMYILWVLGALRSLLNLDYTSVLSVVLTKLPAMICDVGAAYLIYLLARNRFSEKHGLICAALYVFNPAVLINSTIWGQVDAVTTFFMLLVCYFIQNKKLPFAYIAFALGFLMKPQMAFIFPVLVMGIIDQVFLEGFQMRKFLINLGTGLASIAGMFLLAMPFGISYVIPQYFDTVNSYPKATVNAYNFWAMLGLNWHDQTERFMGLACSTWGTIFIILIFVMAFVFWFKSKKNSSKYLFISGFIIVGIFTLSVRMHERYMFYALALFMGLYAMRPRKSYLAAYVALSIVHLINVADVLFYYDAANFDWEDPLSRTVGFFMVATFIGIVWLGCRYYMKEDLSQVKEEKLSKIAGRVAGGFEKKASKEKKSPIRPSEKAAPITKWDVLFIILICVVFGAITLHDLGDRQAPESGWESHTPNEQILLEFDDSDTIAEIHYYLGNYHKPKFDIATSADGTDESTWNTIYKEEEFVSVFKWQELKPGSVITDPYLRFTSLSNDAAIWEMVFLDEKGNQILPLNANEYPELFDEQDLFPERTTNLNSTYFDEIYHARTAYEYIHGLYSYENTHPPLGKILISLGIRIFGMNPFGWRIIGALFGIAMLPFIYLFVKRMFKYSWLAVAVTLLFTFDFMHFVQTRIATIDVYITFFVILMYYFMYRYSRMSFYDTPLQKTFVPLALCGVSMGLGIASKWTGVYAAAGLAIVFFTVIYRRYKEYVYAKVHLKGETEGISHKEIVRKFPIYTRKTILFCCIVFIVIPVCIYILSYIPFNDNSDAGLITRMVNNQKTMFNYHSKLVSEHDFSSRWYQWPIMTRPIWYYSGKVSDTVSEGISAFGNPLVWWAGIPAFVYMIYLAIAKKDRRARFLIIGYLAQYLPWFFVSRTTYIYHYFPSVPFVTLMLGYVFYQFAKEKKSRIAAVFVYVAAAVALFVLFYPVLSGHGIDKEFVFSYLRWLDGWVLVT